MSEFGRFSFGLDAEQEARAAALHADSVVIDLIGWGPFTYRSYTEDMNVSLRASYADHRDVSRLMVEAYQVPGRLAVAGRCPEYQELWDQSGVTAWQYELQVGDTRALLDCAAYLSVVEHGLPWLRIARRAADFRAAHADGGHALYVQCQPTPPISRDLGLVDLAYDIGLRVLQLTYNVHDWVGAGCTDRSGAGLSDFGVDLVRHLDELGVVVDGSHCSARTVLDACETSRNAVVATHTAAAALYPHDRGLSDDVIAAVAATGGVVGVVAVPFFLAKGADVDMNAMLDHLEHVASVAGPDHVAIATDWPMAAPKWVLEEFTDWTRKYGFRDEHGIVPTQNLVGLDDYRDLPNITRGLVARGWTDEQIRGALGENFLRVFEQVCG